MGVVNLPSGATIRTFPIPPAGFDPLTADEQTLLRFGFPPRPLNDSESDERWKRFFGGMKLFIEPTFRRSDNIRNGPRLRGLLEGLETSPNWSGAVVYAPAQSTFDSINGQWNVPDPSPASVDGTHYYSSFWIGIDGAGSPDVFQAGVECDAVYVGGNVQKTFTPWWEWYPENEVQITNFPVSAGQTLACMLTVVTNTTGNVYLQNLTASLITMFQITAPAGTVLTGNSAEWIAERPGINGTLSKLANYGVAEFVQCNAHTTTSVNLTPTDGDNVNMTDGGQTVSEGFAESPSNVHCVYTGPHPVEVHVASGVSQFQTRIFERATTFANETDGVFLMADYDRDGIPDLVFIKTANTPTGHVEVHIASGASQYQTRIFERATTFGNETDGVWLMADYDRDGIPDLVFIKTANTPTGHVEVHIASGASQYQTRVFEKATTFGNETDGVWQMAAYNGLLDLVFIKTFNA